MRPDTGGTSARHEYTESDRRERGDETEASHETGQRYTVHEAALLLGLTVDAVRKRAERGRLKREKGPDGTVYILLDADQPAAGRETRRAVGDGIPTSRDALINSLQDQIEHLRRELDIRNEELRRKDKLLAVTLERIPELETLRETPPEGADSSKDVPEPGESSEAGMQGADRSAAEAQEPAQRRSWLYRFFFGP